MCLKRIGKYIAKFNVIYLLILKYAYVNMRKPLLISIKTKQNIWNLLFCIKL